MEHPVRVAFCKVFFWKNGGQFNDTGLPVFEDDVRGNCDRAWDCGVCTYLGEWIEWLASQGWEWGWECDRCLRLTLAKDRHEGVERHVQGFYQAGRRSDLSPSDPEYKWEGDPDLPALEGCTRCGEGTSFLQLVIRRRNESG